MVERDILPFFFRDPVSAGCHLLWSLWGLYLTAMLWKLSRGDRVRQVSLAVFCVTMTILYGLSGVYHSLRIDASTLKVSEATVQTFRLLDHSAIYLLIAGTYTPLFAVLLRGRLRITMLAIVWGLALAGIACKWLLAAPPYQVTVAIYIGFGWIGMAPMPYLIRAVGWRAMCVGMAGGVLYTAGGICDAAHWPVLIPGIFEGHEALHVLDMGGTMIHVYFMVRYVLPYQGYPEQVGLTTSSAATRAMTDDALSNTNDATDNATTSSSIGPAPMTATD